MNSKHARRNLFLILACVLVLVAVFAIWRFALPARNNSAREITVLEAGGPCSVVRDGKTLSAAEGMSLQTGDMIVTGENGRIRVRLDDDKFLYIGASSIVTVDAEGTADASKTNVFVEIGSMLTEVKQKLSSASSFNVVTPNESMSIRGTKTLTEIIEDAVTGHVQTSNAVLEGQVKIKAVKVKRDGTVVSVEKDLGAGEGNAFSSAKEELVSQEEMKSIADTGSSVSGVSVEVVSEEEADVVFDVATFEATFLENVKNILIADAEAAAGEEGLSEEQLESINAHLSEVMESFEEISTYSQEAINAAASGESGPGAGQQPDPVDTPAIQEPSVDPVTTQNENVPKVDEGSVNNEGTTLVEGDTNLITIGDDDDEAGEDGDDAVENGDEANDDDDSEDEESEEERLAREEEERLAREEEEERLAREEEERLAREEEERLAREEEERLEREKEEAAQASQEAHTHVWNDGEIVGAATCTKNGYILFTCQTCGAIITEATNALGHNLEHHDAKAATCEGIGWNEYDTCSRCDYTTYVEIGALGHDLVHHDAQAATCEGIGWNEYDTCSRCNHTTYVEIGALGHDLVHHDAQAATCEGIGWNEYDTCSRCNHTTYVEIGALGHDLVHHDADPATCGKEGKIEYWQCSVCDKLFADEDGETVIDDPADLVDPALEHEYGNWIITTEPYAEYNSDQFLIWHVGTKTKTCRHCQHTVEETVLVTPIIMSETPDLQFPLSFFTDYDTEYYGDDPLLKDFLEGFLWATSPIYNGDYVEIDAVITFVDGDKHLSELNLQDGSTLEVIITVVGDYRETYEDATGVITIVADEPEPDELLMEGN